MLSGKIFFATSLSLTLILLLNSVYGQNYSGNIWYFGNPPQGIVFNRPDDSASMANEVVGNLGTGGGAVAVDPLTMQVLFYTDGSAIYDAENQPIAGGGPLNGDPNLNQAVVVTPDPGNALQYFIFTNDGAGNISSTIIDIAAMGNAAPGEHPLGAIVTEDQITGIANASDGMIVFADGNPLVYYFAYHDAATNELVIMTIGPMAALVEVDRQSLTASLNASNISFVEMAGGTFRLAVSPNEANRNVELFVFDPAAGSLTHDGALANSAGPEGVFDTEWSANGSYLYVSKNISATEGQVYQFDLQNPAISPAPVISPPVGASFGLQMGPDGNIYHIYQDGAGDYQIGRIENPDSVSSSVVYDPAPLPTGSFTGRQFSSFLPAQAKPFNVVFTVPDPVCQEAPVFFFPEWDSEPAPTQFIWNFGDSISFDVNPSYTFDEPGAYPVSLTAIRGQDTSVYETIVNVVALPTDSQGNALAIDLGQDTVICPGATLVLDIGEEVANAADLISWSSGGIHNTPTAQSIEVDTTGIYWVAATLQGGCRLYDAIQVELYGDEYNRMNFWYFGDGAGIDFNPVGQDREPRAVTDGLMIAPEGAATISDINGDLLLYTNGKELYGVDRSTGEHTLIDDNIGGATDATQSALIVPHPGDETLFYIFTVESVDQKGPDNVGALSYTLVDIKGGTAGVVLEKNVLLYSPTGERITAVEMGQGYVLLVHELGTNTFRSYPITDNGIGAPMLSSGGSVHSLNEPGHSEGYMEFSANGTKVAVAHSGPGNTVEVFDYVDSTLSVANPITITFDEPYDEYMVYGLEFSPGMNKLFVTLVSDAGSVLYEVPVADTLTSQQIHAAMDTLDPIYQGTERLGAIQRGPDGQVHVAVEGASNLGNISANEEELNSSFNLAGLDLAGKTSGLGLPNVVQSFGLGPREPSTNVAGALCVGSQVTFLADTTSMIDHAMWTIIRLSDNNVIFNAEVTDTVLQFNSAGEYRATMHMWNDCGFDTTFTHDFEIFPTPEPPTLSDVSILCNAPLMLDADSLGRPGLTFVWSTGDTVRTIAVNQPGLINVSITDANGCSSSNETEVVDARPQVELGSDMTICQFDSSGNLQTGISDIAEFTWHINGIEQTPPDRSFVPIITNIPGVYEYEVEVLDPLAGCAATDSITITVNAQPNLDVSSDPSACGASDGALIIVNNPQGYSFEWFDAANQPVSDPANVGSGTYRVVITDDISGCTQTKTQSVVDDPANFTIAGLAAEETCEGGKALFTIDNAVAGSQIDYTLTHNESGQIFDSSLGLVINNPAQPIETQIVPAGNYTLEATFNGCRQSGNVVLTQLPMTDFDLNIVSQCLPNTSVEVVNLSGAAPYTFEWSGSGNFSSAVNPAEGMTESGPYQVRVKADNLCPHDSTFTLQLHDNPEVNISKSSDGCGGSIVFTAEPAVSGAYSFLWSPANVGGRQLSYNNPGPVDNITVTILDMATGCQGVSDPVSAIVYDEVIVEVASTVPCDDGMPIIMTATGNQQNLTFNWFDSNNSRLNAFPTSEFEVDSAGYYRVVGTIEGSQCSDSAEIDLIRMPLTPVDLLDLYTYCSEDPVFENSFVEVIPTGDFLDYSWIDLESGSEIHSGQVFQVEGGNEGEYIGRFTNAFGCITTDTIQVDNDCVPLIFAPNAFTPNSDGKNDKFLVFPRYISEFEIFVFNRWGEVVFYAETPDFEWDGRYNGDLLPMGTYPYLIRYRSITDPNRGVIEKRGGVLLLR